MKTRTWLILIAAVAAVCLMLSIPAFFPKNAATARILSDGKVVAVFSLAEDQTLTVPSSQGGYNIVSVRNGAIAVTEATCPDHYCMHRGYCTGGSPIVCLPNRLVIEFISDTGVDGIA